MNCAGKKINSERCTCTNTGCDKYGVCCECVAKHLAKRQVPGCFFDKEGEATWDRSFEHFAKLIEQGRV